MSVLTNEAVIIMMGINIILGLAFYITFMTGQLSLGHAAFMAIGAYASGILTTKFGLPLVVALIIAMVGTGVFGGLAGFPALRTRDIYLAILTLGLAQVVNLFFRTWDYVGGIQGMAGMTGTTLSLVYISVGFCLVFMWKFSNSRIGWSFTAVKENEGAAAAMAINVTYIKVLSFALGAAVAALAGGLYAHYAFFIDTEYFSIILSLQMVLFVIFGGIEVFWGPVIGAVALTLLPEYLRGVSGMAEWRIVFYGAIMMAVIVFKPQGLLTRKAVMTLTGKILGKRKNGDTASTEKERMHSEG